VPNEGVITINVPVNVYGAVRNGFEAGNIHYEGIERGGPWKSRLFWARKWLRAKRVPFGHTKVFIPEPTFASV